MQEIVKTDLEEFRQHDPEVTMEFDNNRVYIFDGNDSLNYQVVEGQIQ